MRQPPKFDQLATPSVPLAEMTWFRLGGAAEWFAEPDSLDRLSELTHECGEHGVSLRMLGQGANLLIADEGVDGVVVRLKSSPFRTVQWPKPATGFATDQPEEALVIAGGGADMSRLVIDAVRQGLAGIECMAGIPGTLGGIIRMNAGGRFGQIGDVVRDVTVIERDGRQRTLTRDEIGFNYRHTDLGGAIICRATLALRRDDPKRLREKHLEIMSYKKATQPLGEYSAGCVFKNPPERSAGRLIDEAGLKGRRVGGAFISTQHANFIVAQDGATARDVRTLIGIARREVADRFGIELETEIEIWEPSPARSTTSAA